jgi:monoamine oxidase
MDYAEPVQNLIFAGEHTSFNYHGFMEGAVESGKIAADIIWHLKNPPHFSTHFIDILE